jgi:hypothetical protein
MRKSAIGLLTLTIYATALVIVPAVPPAKAETNGSESVETNKKKIQENRSVSDRRSSSQAWPPPVDEDPDRKKASAGGGGM